MQSLLGSLLFNGNTHRSIHGALGRLGICVSYSTTIERLRSLGMSAATDLKSIGRQWVDGKVFLHFTYDNVNQYTRSWNTKLGSESAIENGTAGYVIVRDDIETKAFDGAYYESHRSLDATSVLTWDRLCRDLDHQHLENVAVGHILRIILTYIPFLKTRHSDLVETIFSVTCVRHPVPVCKTKYHSLQCSAYDEGTTAGNRDVVHDYVKTQMGIMEEELDGRLIGFSGDQLTVSRLRTLRTQTDSGFSWFSRNLFVLPQIEFWHMGAAFQKGIFDAHWNETVSKEDVGLHFAADRL